MGTYLYQHEETEEVREIIQGMNEKHVYRGTPEEIINGKPDPDKWRRIFTSPAAIVDGHMSISPYSAKQFVNVTGKKKGTVGDVMDLSRELSEKRAKEHGEEDPIKRKYFNKYSKMRHGRKHPEDRPKKIETNGVTVDFD